MECEAGETTPDPPNLRRSGSLGAFICGPQKLRLKDIFTWRLLKTVALGQVLSMLVCGTAVTSQYLQTLDQKAPVETPMLQSFLNYVLLFLTYTLTLVFRKGDGNIFHILKSKWWKYLLLALTDVQANYTVVKAYQFTTLTSIQLLDCFVIPVLMVLSWFFLKTRYRPLHFVAVGVCLLGVGAMVGADLLAERDQGSNSNVLLGDCLVLISAALYAVSNVGQEYTVKNLSRVEFLGMIGLFGTLISGVQMAVLEIGPIAAIDWDWYICLLFVAFMLCMYGLYSFMPVVMKMTSATAVNLSLLTADLFSLLCGIFLFDLKFSGLYIVSFVVITVGFIMFNVVPTYTPDPPENTERAYESVATSEVVQGEEEIILDEGSENCAQRACGHGEPCPSLCTLRYMV
ncbi:solute carrier family 35 member F2 [Astyanax mexicanus]|uniref:Solute carrier family 35 member F2-like n=1 Tax=Astyanax mexicanus TaxID=7994 RepID=A0A8B9JLP7_ASTMX|nr:solute carrier family 35 member F2 [Astyanax mexicanus]KAG9265584.1 solute carrier family 35 member F2-like [Astyanax mexicanus]